LFPHIIPLTKKAQNIWFFCDICIFPSQKYCICIVNRIIDRDPRLPRNIKNCRNQSSHALRQFSVFQTGKNLSNYFCRSPQHRSSNDSSQPKSNPSEKSSTAKFSD
jgi:hypothetical protein